MKLKIGKDASITYPPNAIIGVKNKAAPIPMYFMIRDTANI